MMELQELRAFVAVVEGGSFTAAARTLGVTPSYASRLVGRLEERLEARLLRRTTRRLSLTDTGTAFLERIRPALAALDEAAQVVVDLGQAPAGLLRVSLPHTLGVLHLAELLAEVVAAHPALELDLCLSDRQVDLVGEGFDLAVRVASLADSSLVARRLGSTRRLTCASPAYLACHGTPTRPADLAGHRCLLFAHQQGGHRRWIYEADGETVAVAVRGRVTADDGQALLSAARAGLGILRVPDFMLADELRDGRLVRLLPAWESETGIWALYPHARHLQPKVRVAVDHLAARLREAPWTMA